MAGAAFTVQTYCRGGAHLRTGCGKNGSGCGDQIAVIYTALKAKI